jgi:hypothetical protein
LKYRWVDFRYCLLMEEYLIGTQGRYLGCSGTRKCDNEIYSICSYQLTDHLQKIGDAVTSLNEAFTWFSTALV